MSLALWFDVEMIRYTTEARRVGGAKQLWFDVEMIRYTTLLEQHSALLWLWFDVEMIRYTTYVSIQTTYDSCGLM